MLVWSSIRLNQTTVWQLGDLNFLANLSSVFAEGKDAKKLGLLFQTLKFKTHDSLLSKYNVWCTKKGFKEAGKI